MECIFCFENYKKEDRVYKCINSCFFNDKCNICKICLNNWLKININENNHYNKCPICADWSLKNVNDRCIEYKFNCKIKFNNRIYPNIVSLENHEICNKRCKYTFLYFVFLGLLVLVGFLVSTLYYFVKYNDKEFEANVVNDKWNELSYFIFICPGISIILMGIYICIFGFCTCLDNIC